MPRCVQTQLKLPETMCALKSEQSRFMKPMRLPASYSGSSSVIKQVQTSSPLLPYDVNHGIGLLIEKARKAHRSDY